MDEMRAGDITDCGSYSLAEAEVVDFARRHDPQDFHIFHEAAKHSLFGRLTASGIHSASEARKAVLTHVFAGRRLLGYPRVLAFRMLKPVYLDMPISVRHRVASVEPVAGVADVVTVECVTEGRSGDGELVCEMHDLNWVGVGRGPSEAALQALKTRNAPPSTGAPATGAGPLAAINPAARIYYEDCTVGDRVLSAPFPVTSDDVETFRRRFDTAQYRNEWLAPSFAIPLHWREFWSRAENTGGPGMQDMRVFNPLEAGDFMTGLLTITAMRPLRSRPTLGAVSAETFAWNQHGQPVFLLATTSFMRRDDA